MFSIHSEPDLNASYFKTLLTGFDVCLCTGGDCPLRFLCHCFLAEPVSRQDFFGTLPYHGNGKCPEYWDARETFRFVLNPGIVQEIAYKISKQNQSDAELYWVLAEVQSYIQNLINAHWVKDEQENHKLVVDLIPKSSIRDKAYFLWIDQPSPARELHWAIAEQCVLFLGLKQRNYLKIHHNY